MSEEVLDLVEGIAEEESDSVFEPRLDESALKRARAQLSRAQENSLVLTARNELNYPRTSLESPLVGARIVGSLRTLKALATRGIAEAVDKYGYDSRLTEAGAAITVMIWDETNQDDPLIEEIEEKIRSRDEREEIEARTRELSKKLNKQALSSIKRRELKKLWEKNKGKVAAIDQKAGAELESRSIADQIDWNIERGWAEELTYDGSVSLNIVELITLLGIEIDS